MRADTDTVIVFSGYSVVGDKDHEQCLIYDSNTALVRIVQDPALNGLQRYISFGGGAINTGGIFAPNLTALIAALEDGSIPFVASNPQWGYHGLCLDIEEGSGGMEPLINQVISVAKGKGFKVMVSTSHNVPWQMADAQQLYFDLLTKNTQIDYHSPMLYGANAQPADPNDYTILTDGGDFQVPWSLYGKTNAAVCPSISNAANYDTFNDESRNAQYFFSNKNGVTTQGYTVFVNFQGSSHVSSFVSESTPAVEGYY
eukprot:gene25094-31509_t